MMRIVIPHDSVNRKMSDALVSKNYTAGLEKAVPAAPCIKLGLKSPQYPGDSKPDANIGAG